FDLASSPVIRSEDAAARLRALVLRAEQENGTPLESSFQMFDRNGEGYVTEGEFKRALKVMQNGSFASLDDECCEELAALFDVNQDGQVSLLDFYRFMGRSSPPLKPSSGGGGGEDEEEEEEVSDFELENEEDEDEEEEEDEDGDDDEDENDEDENDEDEPEDITPSSNAKINNSKVRPYGSSSLNDTSDSGG
ncbi:hypothetical protein TrRE_jg3431, partial [Triparma retinervis]